MISSATSASSSASARSSAGRPRRGSYADSCAAHGRRQLQSDSTEVLQRLVRSTPSTRPATSGRRSSTSTATLTHGRLRDRAAGRRRRPPEPRRDLRASDDGPTLCLPRATSTRCSPTPSEWTHDPWSGDVADGFLWGRGALDMKSQVAAEAVAGAALAARRLAAARGTLKLVFVADEETGGDVGASWLSSEPSRTRSAATCCSTRARSSASSIDGRRRYGVCCAEKGIFRFNLTALGRPVTPRSRSTGDNALLKLAPVLAKLADQPRSRSRSPRRPAALLAASARTPPTRRARSTRSANRPASARSLLEPMFERHADADHGRRLAQDERDSVARADPGRLPGAAGLGEDAARRRIAEVWATTPTSCAIEFTEQIVGQRLPGRSELMSAIDALGPGQRSRRHGRATDPARLLGLALVPRRVPRLHRLRVLPPALSGSARVDSADAQRRRANRRARSRLRRHASSTTSPRDLLG